MARTLYKELTFQMVKVAPFHSPPASAVKSTDPFIRPADRPTTQSTPASTSWPGTDSSADKHQFSGKPQIDQPQSDQELLN